MTLTIYHNPRCSKSRQTLELLEQQAAQQSDLSIDIVEYLKTPLNIEQLTQIKAALGLKDVRDMMRSNEAPYKDANLSDSSVEQDKLFDALATHPILLQRPIVVKDQQAIIGRPPATVLDLFD